MVGSGGGACSEVVLPAEGVFNQLILSSALTPPPHNTGAESNAATAAEIRVLVGKIIGGTETAGKRTPIFPHNASQGYGP